MIIFVTINSQHINNLKKVKDEFVPDFAKALIEIEFEIGKVFYINNTKLIFYVD